MNQELQNYINAERNIGTSDEVIKQKLRASGWKEEMFNDYFFITNQPAKSNLQEYSQETRQRNKLIFIVIIVVIVIAGSIYLAFAKNWIGFNNVQKELISEDGNNVKNDIVIKDELIIENKIENWKIYDSAAGFSFKYPENFIKGRTLDEAFDTYSANDNQDEINLFNFEKCDFIKSWEYNSNEPNIEGCILISVSKKEKENILFGDMSDLYISEEEGAKYVFAGIDGKLVTSIGSNISYDLTGELGDYIFIISVIADGLEQNEIFYIFEEIAKSFQIDKSLTTKVDRFSDADSDGLLDRMEILYGTNINITDTDGDGKSDRDEVNDCYNPLGDGLITIEQFQNFCISNIAASSFLPVKHYDNREELCKLWQPIAKDFINNVRFNDYYIIFYTDIYIDYPEMCESIDSLIGEKICGDIRGYLSLMCPRYKNLTSDL